MVTPVVLNSLPWTPKNDPPRAGEGVTVRPRNLAKVSEMKVTTDPVSGMGLTFHSFPSGAWTMAGRAG